MQTPLDRFSKETTNAEGVCRCQKRRLPPWRFGKIPVWKKGKAVRESTEKASQKKRSKSARVASESVGEKKIETVFPQSARLYLQSASEICSKKARRSCVFIYNIQKLVYYLFLIGRLFVSQGGESERDQKKKKKKFYRHE